MKIKKFFTWKITFGLALVGLSLAFYYLDYVIFHDLRHIFLYLIGDTAFLFLQVFLITLIIEQMLAQREKIARLHKLNMLIGIFFTEVGGRLLSYLRSADTNADALGQKLVFNNHTTAKDFARATQNLKEHACGIDIKSCDLESLKRFLLSQRTFLSNLLANSSLLEHERFTNLLWAVLHLMEELSYRDSFDHLSPADKQHLDVDARRAYQHLLSEWIHYLQYLKDAYPYLYSLAIRTNPFDATASVKIA